MLSSEDIFRDLLQKEFDASKLKNRRYSLRSFAGKLELSAGTLSDLLNGKTKLGPKRMSRVVEKLTLTPHKKARILKVIGSSDASDGANLVDQDDHGFLAEWFNRSVLLMFDLGDVSSSQDPEQVIFQKLGGDRIRLHQCIQMLLRKKLLQRRPDGTIFRPPNLWKTSDGSANDFVRRHHLSNAKLANEVLEKVPAEERDFTSMMFTGNAAQVEALKAEIRRFYEKALVIMENGVRDELYQISISLYPINKQVAKTDE